MGKVLLLSVLLSIAVAAGSYAQSSIDNSPTESPVLVQKALYTANNIELFPNPVKESLNIKIENSTFDKVEFELYNIIGNSLKIQVEETGKNSFRISMKDLNPGYYLLLIKDPVKRINKSIKFQKM